MTDHINAAHASLEAAAKPMSLDALAKRLYGATPTKMQLKATERELKALHQAGLLESTPGRGGLPYYSLITPTAPAAPQPKPSAAAAAVFAALDGGPTPGPDLAEQLREAHAERLAMSQTIIAICCAIGRDPATTTTAELPQALRDYIDAQVEQHTAGLRTAIADIREAVGDVDNVPPAELARYIKIDRARAALNYEEGQRLMRDCCALTDELMAPGGLPCYPWHGLKAAALLIDAHHAHIGEQADEIMALKYQVEELQSRATAQARQHQAETGLLAEKNARLHAEIEHLRSRPTPMTSGATTPTPDAYLVTRHLRAGRGKTVADTDGPTRHKSIDTATRKARAAIRGGYVRAEIHATHLVAVAVFGAEIKPARC